MEDELWWMTNIDGRRLLIEDNLWCRPFLMEDYFWSKNTYDGRIPLMEDYLWWKTTFDGWLPLWEDYLWWKTTFVKEYWSLVLTSYKWYLVPITYLACELLSGWTNGLGFFIASLFVGCFESSMGVMSGQEMSLLGSLSSNGFSKQPRLSPPKASSASTGYRWSKSEANVQASSQTRSKGHF